MKLIVGLGNPGGEYANTRHNIGYMIVEKLARELGTVAPVWEEQTKHNSIVARVGDVLLVKPLTFMNNSGGAVQSVASFYKVMPVDVWVVHDDMDLPLGKIRIREKGGSAGHNGVTSIIEKLKSDQFVRFRLGIGRGRDDTGRHENKNLHHRSVIRFVLSRFSRHEGGELKHLVKHGTSAVRMALIDGLDKAMNRFN